MGIIRIQKNPKRKVRIPETGVDLAEGRVYEVEDSVHWRRRIQSGDVKEIIDNSKDKAKTDAAKQAAAEAEKKKAEEEAAAKQAEEEAEEKRKADEDAAKQAAGTKSGGKKK